jgi:hypothetical protein
MFTIENFEERIEGQKLNKLDIYDDEYLKFFLMKENEKHWVSINTISMRNSYCK